MLIKDNRAFGQISRTAWPSNNESDDWHLTTFDGDIADDLIYATTVYVATSSSSESIEIVPMEVEYDEELNITYMWWA
jgi:hypothetical protein